MNIVTQNYDLDMIPGDVPLIVPVKQYDNTSRQIQFTLYSGSNAFILQSTASVRCDGTKPDGNGFSETCSYSGNVVTLVVTQQMAAVSGNVPCQLTVTDGTGVIGTATFILFVWPAALNSGTVVSDSDVAAIIAQAQSAANSAAEAVSASNEAVSAVSSKADKAQPSAANNVALLSADGNLLDSGKLLTPGAIGAAPAGYGLGSASNDLSGIDLNTVTQNGWYNITSITVNSPVTYGAMRVDNKDLTLVIQTIYSFDDNYNSVLRRFKTSSGWGSWRYTNKNMSSGVEYLTDETWNGSPVYKQFISLGTGSVGKTIQTGITGTMIGIDVFGTSIFLPYIPSGSLSGEWSAYYYVEENTSGFQIILQGGSGGLNRTLYAILEYVKT